MKTNILKTTLLSLSLLSCVQESQGATLLSNLGQTPNGTDTSGVFAQGFRTGGSPTTLYSVTLGSIEKTTSGTGSLDVLLFTDFNGNPFTYHYSFTGADPSSIGDYTFSNSVGIDLAPDSQYWIVPAANGTSTYTWSHATDSSTTGAFSVYGNPKTSGWQDTTITTPFLFSLQDSVPEPSRMLLLGLAGMFGVLRPRRRVA